MNYVHSITVIIKKMTEMEKMITEITQIDIGDNQRMITEITKKITEMVNKSKFKPQLQAIFLDGCYY